MKRRILLVVCFVFAVEQPCLAMWARIPLKDLIRESDVIVVGKLKRVKIIKRKLCFLKQTIEILQRLVEMSIF